jgi:hypothetical protein
VRLEGPCSLFPKFHSTGELPGGNSHW